MPFPVPDPSSGSGPNPNRIRQFYCQLSQTYLPPSYVPPSCQISSESYPQWGWSLMNTVFVSVTTVFNTTIVIGVVFLWLVNRQFHFKEHSYDKEPLRPLKKPAKALKSARTSLKKAAKKAANKIRKKKKVTLDAEANGEGEVKQLSDRRKSFQSFLEDFEHDDEDEDEVIERSLSSDISKKDLRVDNSSAENLAKKKQTRDLLQLASKIEVFSYLSPEAVADILKYVEYVDFKNVGDVVYDTDSLDGSMYAVVTGEVSTRLSIQDDAGDSSSEDFSFVAGPGEVITSMLSIITSLVREYQLQDILLHSLIPGVLSDGTGLGGQDRSGSGKIVIPHGMNVEAIVTKPGTRLLRVPSRCFVAILEKFPRDVQNICQTIVARLQRVTIQTLVRFLGLDVGIMGIGGSGMGLSSPTMIPEKKPRNETAEWRKFEQHLLSGNTATSTPLLDRAVVAAGSLLGLSPENSNELKEGAEIVHAAAGQTICTKGEAPDSIYMILTGSLEVGLEKNGKQNVDGNQPQRQYQNGDHKKATRTKIVSPSGDSAVEQKQSHFKPLFNTAPGNWVGLFSCFTHDASIVTVRNPEGAESQTWLLKIPAITFEKVISKYPRALYHCLLDIIDTIGDGANLCVSPAMFLLDMSLDWMHVEAGEYIALRGEPVDSMFLVLSGRLRAESTQEEKKTNAIHKEYGRGSTIGELEALAEGCWSESVFAMRHVEVARIPIRIINLLMQIFPGTGIHFAKVIASQVQLRRGTEQSRPVPSLSLLPSYSLSIATVAVVPLTEEVEVSEFCEYLTSSLRSLAPTKHLTKRETKGRVGQEFFKHRNAMLKVKLTRILGDLEESNRLVVYESDYKYTWWTKLCIQQADCVLVLVDSKSAPELKRVEECLAWANEAKNVRIELVVIETLSAQDKALSDTDHASDNLNNWSEERKWISKHHLVRSRFADHVNDFRRMTRRITGQSIGLVLGGGGARGLAHLGIIKALNEAGVPVDMVGGTSQGAFVGALLARSPDDYGLLSDSVREMASDMASVSNKLRDLTFPLTSFFSGHHFNRGIKKILGNARIQDFVLNFYCVSVDICNSRQVVHSKGLAWKYVRASMSLTGYLPPVSENKSLLVDGGYMNVVPADVMAEMGAKKVIAVDVSKDEQGNYYEYGTELSGIWLLWNSWCPFVQTVKVPSMGDINELLSWVSSERVKKDVEKKVDLFLRPPVNHIGTLDYDKIDEIVKIGYDYAKPLVEEWAKENGYQQQIES